MEFRCKLSEVGEMVFRLHEAIKEPLRTYEVHPTEESLGWGRSMVCEYDYTVRVPKLKIYFRDAVEFEFTAVFWTMCCGISKTLGFPLRMLRNWNA